MTPTSKSILVGLLAFFAVLPVAVAGTFPDRPLKLLVPYPPTGTTDFMARLLGQKLSEAWGRPVVIENRPGASGNIGMDVAAKAPPDGYTLAVINNAIAINVSLFPKQPFDVVRDFAPLGLIASTPMILAANPALPAKSLRELTTLAQSEPGKIFYASCGNGTPQHLAVELYKSMAKVDLAHVPYKGCAPAVTDLLGGQVQLLAHNTSVLVPLIQAGRLRGLGVTSKRRSTIAPDIPTFDESGVPGYGLEIWYGVLAPAATPKPVRDAITAQIGRVLRMDDVRARMRSSGIDELIGTPDEQAVVLKRDLGVYAELIAKLELQAE